VAAPSTRKAHSSFLLFAALIDGELCGVASLPNNLLDMHRNLIQAACVLSKAHKVVRAALQGAASVAGLLITTEAMIAEAPKRESAPAMPGGGGMGGMGGMDY